MSESSESGQRPPRPAAAGGYIPATPPPMPGHASSRPPSYPSVGAVPPTPPPPMAPPVAPPGPSPAPHPVRPTHYADARLSLTALLGALWAPLFFLMLLLSSIQISVPLTGAGGAAVPFWHTLLNYTLQPLGFTAPFATTVLGLIAIGRIQRSNGHRYGLSLALFDSLLYPLLFMDVLIFWACFQLDSALVSSGLLSAPTSAVLFRHTLPTIACILGDYHLATRAWAAVQPREHAN